MPMSRGDRVSEPHGMTRWSSRSTTLKKSFVHHVRGRYCQAIPLARTDPANIAHKVTGPAPAFRTLHSPKKVRNPSRKDTHNPTLSYIGDRSSDAPQGPERRDCEDRGRTALSTGEGEGKKAPTPYMPGIN